MKISCHEQGGSKQSLMHILFADDSTGLYSVYSEFEGNEIMFHVSTLLPYTPNNR